MSLDETLEQMRAFEHALARFDEAQRIALAALERRHIDAQALWQDEFAREYAQLWEPLGDGLRRWTQRDGPAYREFIADKLHSLSLYLGHRR